MKNVYIGLLALVLILAQSCKSPEGMKAKGDMALKKRDYATALSWYEKAAEKNYAPALYALGEMYYNGLGVSQDYRETWRRDSLAAGQNYGPALARIGEMLLNGHGVEQNIDSAIRHYTLAAKQDVPAAQYGLWLVYKQEGESKVPYSEAVMWLGKASESGHPQAQLARAQLYYGMKQWSDAYRWFEIAATQNNLPEAQCMLGLMNTGIGSIKSDYYMASQWYRRAAEQGYAPGQYNLGLMYRVGHGVDRDPEEGVRLIQKAADQGYELAQNAMGDMYLAGQNVSKDVDMALYWYFKAAENGSTEAPYTLGKIYLDGLFGQGVDQNVTTALKWFRKAAENGSLSAKMKLGEIYYNGKYVKKDLAEALKWYEMAKEAGVTDAGSICDKIRREMANPQPASKSAPAKKKSEPQKDQNTTLPDILFDIFFGQ